MSFLLPVVGIIAIVISIRAIVLYRRGSVTILWAPIVGLVLGGLLLLWIVTLFFIGVIAGATAAANAAANSVASNAAPAASGATLESGSPNNLGVSAADTINYSMGDGKPTYLPSGNTSLSNVAGREAKLVAKLKQTYAYGSYPAHLTLDSKGRVVASGGKVLGSFLKPGWWIAYKLDSDGSFMIEMTPHNTQEVAVYYSGDGAYWAWCGSTDATCATSSPVAPSRSLSPNF